MKIVQYRSLLRVSLRLVFLTLTVFALGFAFWAHQAQKQRSLADRIVETGGSCKRRPLELIPDWLRSFIGEEFSSSVVEVSVGGNLAPLTSAAGSSFQGRPVKAIAPTDLKQLLSLQAMRNVEILELYGSAISDDMILGHIGNLPKLRSLRLHMTAVTQKGATQFSSHLPSCQVSPPLKERWEQMNGPEIVQWLHRDQLRVSEELGLFRRVENGEPDAVHELLRIGAEHQPRYASIALDSLSKATSHEALTVLRKGLADGDPRIRRLAVEALGMMRNYEAVSDALSDADSQVRMLCLRYLARINSQRALTSLIEATQDEDAQVRWLAVENLSDFHDDQTLDALIQAMADESDTVRSAAARVLGGFDHPRSIDALRHALLDKSHFVRKSATTSLERLRAGGEPSDSEDRL